jgi:hypothetical protein
MYEPSSFDYLLASWVCFVPQRTTATDAARERGVAVYLQPFSQLAFDTSPQVICKHPQDTRKTRTKKDMAKKEERPSLIKKVAALLLSRLGRASYISTPSSPCLAGTGKNGHLGWSLRLGLVATQPATSLCSSSGTGRVVKEEWRWRQV